MTTRLADRVRRPRTAATTPAATRSQPDPEPGATAHEAPGAAIYGPPTEAEIRTAVAEGLERRHHGGGAGGQVAVDSHEHLDEVFWKAGEVVGDSDQALSRRGWVDDYSPAEDHPGTLWADLTADETEYLHAALEAARERWREAAEALLVDELAAAAETFALVHPDVPRGRWRPA